MKKVSLSIPTLTILSACIALAITPAWADDLTVFSNGSVADANDVNANFTELETRIDTISLTPGEAGAAGAQGIQGNQGFQGNQGLTGAAGATGAQGVQGVSGSRGATGATGLLGLKGDNGAQGVIGDAGAKGEVGNTGAVGATGAQGVIGDAGAKGEVGNNGIDGRNASVDEINEIKERISDVNNETLNNVMAVSNIMEDVLHIEQIADIDRDNSFDIIGRLDGRVDDNEVSIDDMSFKIFNNENNIQNNSDNRVIGEVEGNLQYWDGMTWSMIAPPTADNQVLQSGNEEIKWVNKQEIYGCRIWDDLGIDGIYANAVGTNASIDVNTEDGFESLHIRYIGANGLEYDFGLSRDDTELLYFYEASKDNQSSRYVNFRVITTDMNSRNPDYELVSPKEFDYCLAVLKRAIVNSSSYI
jgi:hypothetical protein